MGRILSLLPEALICVDEREVGDYRPFVPVRQLIAHPPTTNLSQVRNWIIENIECRCQVQIDDDLRRIIVSDGLSRRSTTDPDEIIQILVNSANICEDAGIGVFAFSRQPNPAIVRQDELPFRLVHPVSSTFGMLGSARYRFFDERFVGRDDFDWSLRTLIEDRIMFVDSRFYFDHGPIFSGRGGNVGLVDEDGFDTSSKLLKHHYGSAVDFSNPRCSRSRKRVRDARSSMAIRVERRQPNVY